MQLTIGATVRCRDGAAGKLKYVVIDPDGEVTHLIVERGMLLHRDIVVPAVWVEQASEQEIMLNATCEELNKQPEYREIDFIQPDTDYHPTGGYRTEEMRLWINPYYALGGGQPWIVRHIRMGVQDDEVILRRGLPVHTSDGHKAGVLDHLVVDGKSHRVTHLVVRRGWLWSQQARIVPMDRVAEVSEYGLWLNMTAEELDRAPLYQPPASDTQIATDLQRALDTDARTRNAGMRVDVQNGMVRFSSGPAGAVTDAARAIAKRIRGVIGFDAEDLPAPAPLLRIGAPVFARDGRFGTLSKVVVDPRIRRVTHMVVRKGWLLTEDRVIPIERVERVDEDGIRLNVASTELNRYPRYREEVFVEPMEGWEELVPYAVGDTLFWNTPYAGVPPPILPVVEYVMPTGVPDGEIVLRRDIDVVYEGQVVGSLDHMLIDPATGGLTHLVVKENERNRRVIVPAEWVRRLDAEEIVLNRWDPDQPGVPDYQAPRNDAAIKADLESRLQSNPNLSGVQVQVDRGVAHLSGNVSTVDDKAAADAIARNTSGVIDVENALTPDTALVGRVIAALAADRRTSLIPIDVYSDRGVVTIKGRVPNPEIKAVAEQIARHVPGVVTVMNELEIGKPERKEEPAPTVVIPPH